jgi:hypothetical protein
MSDRVRDAFEVLMERMEEPPTWEEVRVPVARPADAHRKRHPALAFVAAAAAVIVIGVLAVTLLKRPIEYQLPTLEVAAGETVVSEDPLVVVGTPAPEPQFDTSALGEQVTLNNLDDLTNILDWAAQAESVGEILAEKLIIGGSLDLPVTQSTASEATVGIAVGPEAPEGIQWCIFTVDARGGAICAGRGANDQTPVVATRNLDAFGSIPGTLSWGPAPVNTSVVTLTYGDTKLWQKPVSGIVLFPINEPVNQYTITAYDPQGNQLHTETGPPVKP